MPWNEKKMFWNSSTQPTFISTARSAAWSNTRSRSGRSDPPPILGVLCNLVDLTLAENAKFLLIAGDVYDGNWRDYNTGLFFNAQMSRLCDAGVRVFLISGNHDSQSEIDPAPCGGCPTMSKRSRPAKPETVVLEDIGVAIHGQGFAAQGDAAESCARLSDCPSTAC